MQTAEEFIKNFHRQEGHTFEQTVPVAMIEFAKLHVEKIKNLQESKYYAGETGYILKEEWNQILTNIK